MKIIKYVSFIITIFTPLVLLRLIINGLRFFLFGVNIDIMIFVGLLLVIINIVFILKYNKVFQENNNDNIKRHYLLYAKMSLFSNYIITFCTFCSILVLIIMYYFLPIILFPIIYAVVSPEFKMELLIKYSSIIKLLFFIWLIINTFISFLYFSKFIKELYKNNKNDIIKYNILYFIPIVNIIILIKNGKKIV
jgi:hypothetical protein